MIQDPSTVLVCSPQLFLTPNWVLTLKQYYGGRSVLYIHESHQDWLDPRKDTRLPFHVHSLPPFLALNESDPDLIGKVESVLAHSSDRWLVIMGRQTEALRALHRVLMEKN